MHRRQAESDPESDPDPEPDSDPESAIPHPAPAGGILRCGRHSPRPPFAERACRS
jgi:hypothetical protein